MSDKVKQSPNNRLMIIEVLPLDWSLEDHWFHYMVPEPLRRQMKRGVVIEVPLRNECVPGVVISFDAPENTDFTLRPIESLVSSAPMLAPYQIDLILFLASRYYIPAHHVMHLFLLKDYYRRISREFFVPLLSIKHRSTKANFVPQKPLLIHVSDSAALFEICGNILHKKEKSIVIVPDNFILDEIYDRVSEKSNILFIPVWLSPRSRFRAWMQVKKGEYQKVVGTRSLLFSDLSAYTRIYYLEDACIKTTMHYRKQIAYLDILSVLPRLFRFKIQIISTIPSIEVMSQVLAKDYDFKPNT